MTVFEELERFVPPARLDDWRRWIAYSKKYEPTDEIGHICQAAGWLALLTSETPGHLAERNNQFLEAISAKFAAEQEQRNDLRKAIARLTEILQHQDGQPASASATTPLPKPIPDLEPAAAKIVQAADTLTRLNADRIKYGLLLAWGFGLLSYPVLHFFWNALRQIGHF